jgi:hypothetical protein
MKTHTTHRLAISLFLAASLATLGVAGCASTGGATSAPAGPIALQGARYKLLAAGGALDGRVVEFLQKGDTVIGCLVSPGNRLRNVAGIDIGLRIFSLQKKGESQYDGVYKAITPDGNIADKEVTVFFEGDGMNWNLESATWERQSESSQMQEAEKTRCAGK